MPIQLRILKLQSINISCFPCLEIDNQSKMSKGKNFSKQNHLFSAIIYADSLVLSIWSKHFPIFLPLLIH